MNHHLISDSKWSRCCRFPVINVYLHITPHTLVLFHDRCRCFVEYAADPCVLRRTDERKSRRISRSVSQSVSQAGIRCLASEAEPPSEPAAEPPRQRNHTGAGPDRRLSRHNHIISYRVKNLVLLFSRSCPWHTFSTLIFWSGFVGLLRRERALHGRRRRAQERRACARQRETAEDDWARQLKRFMVL